MAYTRTLKKKKETTIVYWGHIEIMEKRLENAMGFEVGELRVRGLTVQG